MWSTSPSRLASNHSVLSAVSKRFRPIYGCGRCSCSIARYWQNGQNWKMTIGRIFSKRQRGSCTWQRSPKMSTTRESISARRRCRRRLVPMIPGSVAFVAAAAAALVALPDVAPVVSAYESAALLPINSNILRNNMLYWTRDYAVMFYTPWCVECR